MFNNPVCKSKPTNETELHSLCNIIAGYVALDHATTFNAMQIAQHIHECFQIEVNWHDCSSALDVMARTNRIEYDYIDRAGMQVYRKSSGRIA